MDEASTASASASACPHYRVDAEPNATGTCTCSVQTIAAKRQQQQRQRQRQRQERSSITPPRRLIVVVGCLKWTIFLHNLLPLDGFLLQGPSSFIHSSISNNLRCPTTPPTGAPLSSWQLHNNRNRNSSGNTEEDVLAAIDTLFPPTALDQRIALSRKDGYWPYISVGDDPPQEFVYGEFDTTSFAHILSRAGKLLQQHQQQQLSTTDTPTAFAAPTTSTTITNATTTTSDYSDWVFCDLGSGTGRLVLTAAGLHPWKLCRGIELLEGIHNQAVEKQEFCRRRSRPDDHPHNDNDNDKPPLPPMDDGSLWIPPSPHSPPPLPTASATTAPTTSSLSQDAYLRQYQQFSASPSTGPDDEWLGTLSSTLVDPNEREEDAIQVQKSNDEDVTAEKWEYEYEFALPSPLEEGPTQQQQQLLLPLAPIELSCGSFTDPYEHFGDANVIFVFSSAMPYHVLVDLARAVGRQCRPGTLVITTEFQLPQGGTIIDADDDPDLPFGDYAIELVEMLTGDNESTGGLSTVFIQRVTQSAVGDGSSSLPRIRPTLSVSDLCYQAIQRVEDDSQNTNKRNNNRKQDPQSFVRSVSNQMAFLGLPESWRPRTTNDSTSRQ